MPVMTVVAVGKPTGPFERKCKRCGISFMAKNPKMNYCCPNHAKHGQSKKTAPMKFCALDGEGINVNGEHKYVLLGVGQDQIEDENGLSFTRILEFLYDKYVPGKAFVGFFLGYDFNQWWKKMPEDRAAMLLTIQGKEMRKRKNLKPRDGSIPVHLPPHPVEYAGWQFDVLGTKRFKIRPKRCHCKIASCNCKKKAPWMYICDAGPFYQTSLLNVINPAKWIDERCTECTSMEKACPIHRVVSDEEFAIILKGKLMRSHAKLDDDMRYYNRLENEILERVMQKLDAGFLDIGIHLSASKWFGPGQAAQEWLRVKTSAPTKKEITESEIPSRFKEAARKSYFGGWFEVMMHGVIKGITHEYDINSAYPSIIAKLPCLLHGKYDHGKGKPPQLKDNEICLVNARVWNRSPWGQYKPTQHAYIGSMLHRDSKGRICRPMVTEGWFWTHELNAAIKAKCVSRISDDRYFEWVKYTPCECKPPIQDMASLYEKRIEVGKDTPQGKGAKTVYNSGYGKFAQTIGDPIFGNAIYASLITTGCRTMILNAISTHPKGMANVAMVATDAVYFLNEHPHLPLSDKLGEWDYSKKSNLTLFKPGVYWDDKTRGQIERKETPTFKARGVNAKDLGEKLQIIDDWFKCWNGNPPPIRWGAGYDKEIIDMPAMGWPEVELSISFSMTTCLQAIIQHDWSIAGHVRDDRTSMQKANPADKRDDVWYDKEIEVYRSQPRSLAPGSTYRDFKSCEYEKRFGMEDPFSEEYRSQFGYDPDGYSMDGIREILTGELV
jgi:hypothetical protein